MDLYDQNGARLYLTTDERERFRVAALDAPRSARTFCLTLLYTGCRISEALELVASRIDFDNQALTFRTLKKRGDKPHYRAIPVPTSLLDALDMVHGIKEHQSAPQARLWPWSRPTGWTRVKEVMAAADIKGVQASPKGLRHAYGVHAVLNAVPLNVLRNWMGHADIETTAIYCQVIGAEERELAARMWT